MVVVIGDRQDLEFPNGRPKSFEDTAKVEICENPRRLFQEPSVARSEVSLKAPNY